MLFPSPTRRFQATFVLLAFLLSCTSCQLAKAAADVPGRVLSGPAPKASVPPSVVQTGVMRFADTFASMITQATRDFAAEAGTPEARVQAMTWVVGQSTAAFTIATGGVPNANMLDMIVLVSLGRRVHEEHWSKIWGEADRPMIEAYQKLEEEIWGVARHLLTPEQQEAVRTTLDEWQKENPDMAVTGFVRLPAFQDVLAASASKGKNVFSELTNLVSLDPLSGLEPTTREIEQSRLFAERTLFYLQRIPLILPIQAELLGLKLTALPAVGSALADSQRISLAATSLAATAAALPESVRVEREAAVKQLSEELTAQRQGLLRDLEAAQEPTKVVLGEARSTLAAGAEMSVALQGTIQALDAFIGRFQKEEPEGAEPATVSAPAAESAADAGEPSKPFDITDYGDTATRLGVAAGELTQLVATLDRSLPEAQRLMDEVAQRGASTIDHAVTRGVAGGAILVSFAALAVLIVRWISARWGIARAVAKTGN